MAGLEPRLLRKLVSLLDGDAQKAWNFTAARVAIHRKLCEHFRREYLIWTVC